MYVLCVKFMTVTLIQFKWGAYWNYLSNLLSQMEVGSNTSLGLKTSQSILSQMEVADGHLPQRYWTLTLLTLSYLVLALNRRQPLFLKEIFGCNPIRFPLLLITQQVGELGHFLLGATSRDMARWFSNI